MNNRVEFRAEEIKIPSWVKSAEEYIQKILAYLEKDNWDLSVLFCNNKYIKTLNAQFRNKDEATDVLSFPMGEKNRAGRYIAGDILISLDALEENSEFFKVSSDEELRRLLVHGILHLAGEDHEGIGEKEPMIKLQEEILSNIEFKIIESRSN